MEQITPNVYTITTQQGCNPGLVLTSDGAVFIDTAQMVTTLMEMRAIALAHGPIRYLISTEPHLDHISGNHFFAGECPVVSHENLRSVFYTNDSFDCYDQSIRILTKQDPEGLKLFPSRENHNPNPPTITFTDRMVLDVGDTHFRLYYTPGHTSSNICVLVPEEGVIFTADMVFVNCQPWLQIGNPLEWVRSLAFIKTLDFEYLIPGHGPVVDKRYLDVQSAFLYEWIAAVSDGYAKGWTLEECQQRISFADRFPMDYGQEHLMETVQQRNVACVYKLLQNGQVS